MIGIHVYLETCQAVLVVSRSDLDTRQLQASLNLNLVRQKSMLRMR